MQSLGRIIHYGSISRPGILLIAGFGDDSSMFESLLGTRLSTHFRLVTCDLPGFGAPPLAAEPCTLQTLGTLIAKVIRSERIDVVLGHSVASVIASLAVADVGADGPILVSLEGNLTAEDAYFSGTAAEYETADEFRSAFLERLNAMESTQPVVARYRERVEGADPQSLWELGRSAAEMSKGVVPGDLLLECDRALYLYNPDNCPESSRRWIETHDVPAVTLPGVSHWAPVDAPEALATSLLRELSRWGFPPV